jgi:hypothetical protein
LIVLGVSYNTAYRAARGDTYLSLGTWLQLVAVFGLDSLDDVIDYHQAEGE